MSKFDTLVGVHAPARPANRAFAAKALTGIVDGQGTLAGAVNVLGPRSNAADSASPKLTSLPTEVLEVLRHLAEDYSLSEQQVVEALIEPLKRVALFVDRGSTGPVEDVDLEPVKALIRSGRGHMFLG